MLRDKGIKKLDTDKITMVLRMFYSAIYRKIRVDYVLVETGSRLFFSRRGSNDKWKVFLTTDTAFPLRQLRIQGSPVPGDERRGSP